MKKFFMAAFVATSVALGARAQQADKAKIDAYFDALEKNDKFMGNVLLLKDGKAVYQRSVGFADVESGRRLTPDSRFRIGSITKTYTAVLIMKAVEEGRLKLDDKLSKFFPQVPNAGKITLSQMLSHRSGIHNFTDDREYTGYNTAAKSRTEMLALIAGPASDFEPDSKADYSNSNYVLLSFILEDIYKKPYREILGEKILKPLKLSGAYFGGKYNPQGNEVLSYRYLGKWDKQNTTDMSIPMGAGAIVSSLPDLARFYEALFAGKIVSKASLEKMKDIRDGYGLGLMQFPFGDKKSFGHTGGIDGFRSIVSHFPEEGVTYVMSGNGVNFNANQIGLAVLSWHFGKQFEIPDFKTFAHDPAELDKMTGSYASAQIPIGITITREGSTLMAQGSGQSAFALESIAKNTFKFVPAGLEMIFNPEKGEMVLKQGGEFLFRKQ